MGRHGAVIVLWAVLILSYVPAGCSDSRGWGLGGENTNGWSSVSLPDVPRQQAFDAGVYAMQQWFRLDEASPEDGLIKSATTEYGQRGGTERIRDTLLKYPNRMRRTATLSVESFGSGSMAKCVVRVERLDTADHRVFRDNERFDDYPNETPIERDAGVSAGQDQVWTDMPRDRALERQILDVLRSRVTAAPKDAHPQSPAS